ncbi:hypothetical protein HDU81_005096 [Chytriomyces hyalinus]|nr:hypothetical protein HDU81_005096 [Chytriomyces hyalinus]
MLKSANNFDLPELPGASDGKKTVLVAKQVPPDYMGEEPEYTHPGKKPVPLSLILNKTRGPKKEKSGKIIEYTVLGDAGDFEEMEEELGEKPVPTEDAPAAIDPTEEVTHLSCTQTVALTPFRYFFIKARIADARRAEIEKEAKLKEAHEREQLERKRWLERLYIFQKYREVREEHALRNWKRHSRQWARVERTLTKTSKKDKSELLMARLGEFREKIEERDLIYEAFRLLEDQKVNFWSKGLRIGNDLLGLIVTAPKGGVRKIERLVTSEVKHYKVPPNFSYRAMRKQELKHVISKLDPFYKDGVGGYLEVVGKSLDSQQMENLAEAYVEHLENRMNSSSEETMDRKSEVKMHSTPPAAQPPHSNVRAAINVLPELKTDASSDLVFIATNMTFEVLLNEVSRSVFTIYNQSNIAYHFEWTRVVKDNPLKVSAMYDNVQRFYFYHKKGVLLPGTAFDFPIVFKSGSPGIYTEVWELVTNPGTGPDVPTTLKLQGIALEPDSRKEKRSKIESLLDRRVAETAAKEVLDGILSNMRTNEVDLNPLEKRKLFLRNDEQLFMALNADLHLTYNPKWFDKLDSLAAEVLSILEKPPVMWDRSVKTIYNNILAISAVEKRSQLLNRVNELVKLSTATPVKSLFSPLYIVGYDTFIELADKISECSEEMRKRLGLPLVRSASNFEKPAGGEDLDASQDRKPTPPAADAKKGAPAAKDAKGKAPPAKPAPPAKGKKGEVAPAEDASLRPQLAKIIRRVPKPDSSRAWTQDRRILEAQYKNEFKSQVSRLVHDSIDRMFGLFHDVSEYPGGSQNSLESENEIQAAVEVAKGVSKELVDEAAVVAALKAAAAIEEAARLEAEKRENERRRQDEIAAKAENSAQAALSSLAAQLPVQAGTPDNTATTGAGKGGKGKQGNAAPNDKKRVTSPGKERK